MELPVPRDGLGRVHALGSLVYEQEFGLGERGRGVAFAIAEPFGIVGLVIGSRIATKRYIGKGNCRGLIHFVAVFAVHIGGAARPVRPRAEHLPLAVACRVR